MSRMRRRCVAVSIVGVFSVVDLDVGSCVVGVLVDGVLHLTEKVVDVNEILLGAGVRHG